MEDNTKKDHLSEEKPKIEIEINKYKRLVDVLNNPKMLAKSIVVLAVIIVLVFIGVSSIALTIKRFYPYKAVETNKYGATVIKNEDTELTYWLFNTADLWANSGIKVKKGQRITVRTSGAFHSAIHHLVNDAAKNYQRDKWLNATGGMQSKTKQDSARARFRIAPEYEFNTVIMQVIPSDLLESGHDWFKSIDDTLLWDYIDGGIGKFSRANIYKIGDGYENIEIQEDGYLCFACNDIALTKRKITQMMELVDYRKVDTNIGITITMPRVDMEIVSIKDDTISYKYKGQICKNRYVGMSNDSVTIKKDTFYKYKDYGVLNIGSSPECADSTELDYYMKKRFIDAWFVDNVGSFLIVVERKK